MTQRAQPIRVVLVGMPRMLRDIVAGLVSAEPDLAVVGDLTDEQATLDAVDAARPSVVIAGAQAPLLARRFGHQSVVLGVSADGRESVLYELRPNARPLGEISPSTLLAAIRRGVPNAHPSQGAGSMPLPPRER